MEDRRLIGRSGFRLNKREALLVLRAVIGPHWFPNRLGGEMAFGERGSGERVPEVAVQSPQAELHALFLCHREGRSATGGFDRLERSG